MDNEQRQKAVQSAANSAMRHAHRAMSREVGINSTVLIARDQKGGIAVSAQFGSVKDMVVIAAMLIEYKNDLIKTVAENATPETIEMLKKMRAPDIQSTIH